MKISTLSETLLEKIELEEPMTVEELESIITSAEGKKVISEDNKLAAFFERKSRGQKQEAAAAKLKKTPIAQQGEPKISRHRMIIVGGAVLVVLILAVYFLF
ncbi:hypothetical protein SAMN05444673_5925 [Bacillus sp. OV166]|uniref:hypothetical protein n=1 Tax=Bacillus sp. OV166 TaxID=1882763 RepID=UPI000A2AC32B|nr:hypothetical protein [Bacillus sp. OV166]SMQ84477.1 hypothetical protein SAMN05444673_5925 [Bacillus sp. OV166]